MKKKGGKRPGAGRKRIAPTEHIIRARVREEHEQALMLAGNGNISEGIRRLAERHWRLVKGEIKADGTNQPTQSYPVHHRHRTVVRSGQSPEGISGGGEEVGQSQADEQQPRDGTGQAGELGIQPT
jgi:hypothetical protein